MSNKFCIIGTLALVLVGCTHLNSVTEQSTDPKTGIVKVSTRASVTTFLDGNANVTKFSNRGLSVDSTNRYAFAPGTYVGTVNDSSTSTNIATIMGAMAEGVVKGLK